MLRLIRGEGQSGPIVSSAITLSALAALLVAEVSQSHVKTLVPVLGLMALAAVGHRVLLPWSSQITLVVLVIFFIPIKRYELPAALPFSLEPYRIVVGLVCLAWLSSLLIDPRVRLRRSEFTAQILLYLTCITLSLLANPHRVAGVSTDVFKSLVFFASFFLVYFLVVSVIRRRRHIDVIVRALATGGTVLAVLAIVEYRTNYNVFNHLETVAPFLHYTGAVDLNRGGRLRVIGSAQHPIAFGAALMMLVPFCVYLAQTTRQRRWWASALLLVFGALATGSRTAVTMLAAMVLVYLAIRARSVKRAWPALIPAMALIHFALPGTLGTTFDAFFPKGGLIAQQQDAPSGHARLSSLGPALRNEVAIDPLFGEGFATRVTTSSPSTPVPNAPILDDQWLGVLAETGIAGMLSLGWLFVRFFRRLRRAARTDDSDRAWLLTAAAAAVVGYAVGMFTYDAFSFIQVTFLLFIMLGIGAVTLRASSSEWATSPEPSPASDRERPRGRASFGHPPPGMPA